MRRAVGITLQGNGRDSNRRTRGEPFLTVAFSYHIAESIKSGEFVPLLQDFQPPPQPVSFVYSPNRFMPVKLRAFLDFTLPRLRARLGGLPESIAPVRTSRHVRT